MEEYLNGVAAILGVILTAIGAFFAYRRSEATRERAILEAARNGMMNGTAGMVMSRENTKLYVEEFERLTGAIHRLAAAEEAAAKIEREKVEPLARASKESIRMSEALEDMARLMRKRDRQGEV